MRCRGAEHFAAERGAATNAPTTVPASAPASSAAPVEAPSAAAYSQARAAAARSSRTEDAVDAPPTVNSRNTAGRPADARRNNDGAVNSKAQSTGHPRPIGATSAVVSRLSALLGIPDLLENGVAAVHSALDRHHECMQACMAWGSLDGSEYRHAVHWPHKWRPAHWPGRRLPQPASTHARAAPLMSAPVAAGMRHDGHRSRRNKERPRDPASGPRHPHSHEGSVQDTTTASGRSRACSSLLGGDCEQGEASREPQSTQVVREAAAAGDEGRPKECEGQAGSPRHRFVTSEERRSAIKGQLAGLRRRSALKKEV
jgi:hypothetical protein